MTSCDSMSGSIEICLSYDIITVLIDNFIHSVKFKNHHIQYSVDCEFI